MTDKQFKQKEKELREEMHKMGVGWIDGKYIAPPEEYQLREKELSCINMINSILCYQCKGYTNANDVLEYEEKSPYNYLSEYVKILGRKKVLGLIQEQIDSIKGIENNVFTDSEGLSYNSIIWA